jgi:hypothetical protein
MSTAMTTALSALRAHLVKVLLIFIADLRSIWFESLTAYNHITLSGKRLLIWMTRKEEVQIGEEDLELLITMDEPGEDALKEDTFEHPQAENPLEDWLGQTFTSRTGIRSRQGC